MCCFRQNHINVTDLDEPTHVTDLNPDELICVFGKVDEDDMF